MSLVQQYLKPMKDAISNVLETMFYVVPLFESNGSQGCGSVLSFDLESNIEILDESEGMELYFRVTEHFARIITANFLGVGEGEVVVEQMGDTLKEMANIVAGDFLMRLEGARKGVGVPRFRQLTTGEKECSEPESILLQLSCEEERMMVCFSSSRA